MNTHTPTLKNEAALSKAMYESGILKYEETNREGKPKTKHECIRHKERRIHDHLGFSDCTNVSVAWIKCYCDFFNCSADYLLGYIDLPTHQNTDVQKVTGLSDDAIKQLIFINDKLKAYDTGRILLFILSKLIENKDLSISLMSDINSCFDKLFAYIKKKKITDELYKESHGDIKKQIGLLQTKKYEHLSREQKYSLKDLEDLKDLKIHHTQNRFMNILNDFLSKRVEELSKD